MTLQLNNTGQLSSIFESSKCWYFITAVNAALHVIVNPGNAEILNEEVLLFTHKSSRSGKATSIKFWGKALECIITFISPVSHVWEVYRTIQSSPEGSKAECMISPMTQQRCRVEWELEPALHPSSSALQAGVERSAQRAILQPPLEGNQDGLVNTHPQAHRGGKHMRAEVTPSPADDLARQAKLVVWGEGSRGACKIEFEAYHTKQ